MPGAQRTAVGLVGNDGRVDGSRIEALAGVAEVIHVSQAVQAGVARVAAREHDRHDRARRLVRRTDDPDHRRPLLGGDRGADRRSPRARCARPAATALRGGAFKPRSSPYSFQGLGKQGARAARARARAKPGCRSSPRRWTRRARTSSPSTPTASRSARATCRTTRCCGPSAGSASRCCSSAAWRRRSPICC